MNNIEKGKLVWCHRGQHQRILFLVIELAASGEHFLGRQWSPYAEVWREEKLVTVASIIEGADGNDFKVKTAIAHIDAKGAVILLGK